MKPLVALVLTYYDRAFQTMFTLESINRTCYDNFMVVIVDDESPQELGISSRAYRFNLLYVKLQDKRWHSPDVAYNVGIKVALQTGAEIIILQNAESYHMGDVILYASQIREGEYVSCSCFSLGERETYNGKDSNLEALIKQCQRGATHDGDCAWYNHPVYRPVGYDFCSIITSHDLIQLNGFDERFAAGWGYSDDYFLHRVKLLGLRVHITQPFEEPFVLHQWHYKVPAHHNRKAQIEHNAALYKQLRSQKEVRAVHIYTPDFILNQDKFSLQ